MSGRKTHNLPLQAVPPDQLNITFPTKSTLTNTNIETCIHSSLEKLFIETKFTKMNRKENNINLNASTLHDAFVNLHNIIFTLDSQIEEHITNTYGEKK